jgi:hypothetical protein
MMMSAISSLRRMPSLWDLLYGCMGGFVKPRGGQAHRTVCPLGILRALLRFSR